MLGLARDVLPRRGGTRVPGAGTSCVLAVAAGLLVAASARAEIPVPTVGDPALRLSLVASEPEIVNPIGIAVDAHERVYVVESNTHFRQESYRGHPSDRIRVFEEGDDGQWKKPWTFADGFTYAMNLAFSPRGDLYVVERSRVLRLVDGDEDGVADSRTLVLELQTGSVYPHNGLGGITFGPDGFLYVALGQNLGDPYTLRGNDGRTISDGAGHGGGVFRCRPDGTGLERIATGFWNPFGLAFQGADYLVAIDDDPGTRPPNRLLDVVHGSDFGYRRRYERQGEHAFIGWTGDLPGTLPMAGPVGEGSTGLLSTSLTSLSARYDGSVLVTAWSDHQIEVHRMQPRGSTFTADRRVLVKGGDQFRPSGIAAGPSGTIYFADWVLRDYEVHGKGRVWRLRPHKPARRRPSTMVANGPRRRLRSLVARLHDDRSVPTGTILQSLRSGEPVVRSVATALLAARGEPELAGKLSTHEDARVRLGALLARRRSGDRPDAGVIDRWLRDPDPDIRIAILIWVAEEKLLTGADRGSIDRAVVDADPLSRVAMVYKAAAKIMDVPVIARLREPSGQGAFESLLNPGGDAVPKRQVIWQAVGGAPEEDLLRLEKIALDRRYDAQVRADAIAVLAVNARVGGLAAAIDDPDPTVRLAAIRGLRTGMGESAIHTAFQRNLQAQNDGVVREELRFALQDDSLAAPKRPEDSRQWLETLASGGNTDAGRRVFFDPAVGCYRCHRVGPFGAEVGPPLTFMGYERPERLLDGIIHPSVDVLWQTNMCTTVDGTTYIGIVQKHHADGSITLVDAGGRRITIAAADIKLLEKSDASLMPDGFQDVMTVQAFRDLWAFLRNLRWERDFMVRPGKLDPA